MHIAVLLLAAARLWTDAPPVKERPSAPPAAISALVKTAMPAVVGIVATTARGGSDGDPFRDFLERMSGSGPHPREAPVRALAPALLIPTHRLIPPPPPAP